MNRRAFAQTVAAALFAPSLRGTNSHSQSYAGIHPPNPKFLDTLPTLMELATVPGIGIGVVRAGEAIWQHYVGLANTTTKIPINADSLFPAASLGKQPFAFAVLRLADQGKLDLDHPLNQYLADDPITGPDGDRVTARHILSHTSGLPNWRDNAKEPLLPSFTPGTKFRYSGEGFYHLQRVVETITGIGFEAWIETNLFMPISMTSSTYLWSATAKDHFVAGHYRDEPQIDTESRAAIFALIQSSNLPLSSWNHARIVQAMMQRSKNTVPPPPNNIVPNAAATLLTTVGDYTRFLTALLDPYNSVGLSPATRSAMETPAVSTVRFHGAWVSASSRTKAKPSSGSGATTAHGRTSCSFIPRRDRASSSSPTETTAHTSANASSMPQVESIIRLFYGSRPTV